eukprot:364317-Chlamydomonas_euryale.AAC.7
MQNESRALETSIHSTWREYVVRRSQAVPGPTPSRACQACSASVLHGANMRNTGIFTWSLHTLPCTAIKHSHPPHMAHTLGDRRTRLMSHHD